MSTTSLTVTQRDLLTLDDRFTLFEQQTLVLPRDLAFRVARLHRTARTASASARAALNQALAEYGVRFPDGRLAQDPTGAYVIKPEHAAAWATLQATTLATSATVEVPVIAESDVQDSIGLPYGFYTALLPFLAPPAG